MTSKLIAFTLLTFAAIAGVVCSSWGETTNTGHSAITKVQNTILESRVEMKTINNLSFFSTTAETLRRWC